MASVISFPEQLDPIESALKALNESKDEIEGLVVVFRTKEGEYSLVLSHFDIEVMSTAVSVLQAELMVDYLLGGERESVKKN